MKTELSDSELVTYSRQIALEDIDYEGQLRLRNARACVVGLGGLGSMTALKLVGMGIGSLRMVDRDIVSRSDLHRQLLYDRDQVGLPKVAAAEARLSRLNPEVELEPIPASLQAANARDLIRGADIVLDGLDGPEGRYQLNRACQALGIPWVFGAAIQAHGNVTTIVPGQSICLECFMPGLQDEDLPKCAVVGVHPSVLGVVTAVQVFEAVSLIVGREPALLNKLLYIDLKEMDFQKILFRRQEDCPVCGTRPQGEPEPLRDKVFDESCAKDGRRTFFYTPGQGLNLDLEALAGRLGEQGWELQQHSRLGLTAALSQDYTLSVLKSGILIVQAAPGLQYDPQQPVREFCQSFLAWLQGQGLAPSLG